MNKKLKTALAAILAVCSLANLCGCAEKQLHSSGLTAGGANSSDIGINNSNISDNFENKDSEKTEVEKTVYSPIALTDNNTLNSIRLFDAVTENKINAMFSPISLNMALGLLEAGAGGVTKTELDSYLQTENFTDFAENYMKLARERYSHEDEYDGWKNVLEIANSLWADNSLPLKDEYKKTMTERLGAEIENVLFADKENTIGKINGWVSEKTHKLIPKAIADYGENTAAMLINTVYFESAWRYKWRIDGENPEPFMLSDGTKKNIPLMYNGKGSGYYENDKAAAFGMRYMNGMQFIGILPNETGEFTLESLDIPSLLESKSYDYDVTAVMPKLEFESEFNLVEPLKAAGLKSIFDKSADLSGISDVDLFVSQLFQKTKLELDEDSTKAAAVTVVYVEPTAMHEPRERKTVRLDRPFAFMIYDENEDQILFIGKVTEP